MIASWDDLEVYFISMDKLRTNKPASERLQGLFDLEHVCEVL